MFTPGRCKKTISWFCCGGTVWGIAVCPAVTPRPAWGDASAVTAGGTSGEAAADGSAAKNWELIQPFKRPFSTWVQSPSRRVTVNRAPFGAVPTAAPVAAGVDLMFTPGRCKKTTSSHGGTVCGVVLGPAAASGPAWGDAATFTEGATSDPAAADGSEDSSGVVGAAWTGLSSADCTAVGAASAVCVLRAGSPEGPGRKYATAPTANAATSAVAAISFRPEAKLVRSAGKSACL